MPTICPSSFDGDKDVVEARLGVCWTERFDTRAYGLCFSSPRRAGNDDERLRRKSSEQTSTHGHHGVRQLQHWRCLHLNRLPLKPVLELTLRDPEGVMKAEVKALFVERVREGVVGS